MNHVLDFVVAGDEKLHCGGCETRVGNALMRLDGVHAVEASAQDQRIRVTIDPSATGAGQVLARLAQLGYQANLEDA